jgi:transcriptional regulator with XRE-family HTH domain
MLNKAELSIAYTRVGDTEKSTNVRDVYSSTTSNALNTSISGEGIVGESQSLPSSNSEACSIIGLDIGETTGSGHANFSSRLALLAHQISSITSYGITFISIKSPQKKPLSREIPAETLSANIPAQCLRDISKLDIAELAEIFGVSRTTYHKWIRGHNPSKKHQEHLLEVLPLLEKAAQRFTNPSALAEWLLTPVSIGGKKPVEYLRTRQYSLFRGFLLKARTRQETIHPLNSSKRVYRELSKEELEHELNRLRPRAWIEDDNEV